MSEFKRKYIRLNLTGGSLIYDNISPKELSRENSKNTAIFNIMKEENVGVTQIKRGDNLSNPIPLTSLSNMLMCLVGKTPIPSKPCKREKIHDLKERPSIYDEAASKSYCRITSPVDINGNYIKQVVGDDGEYYSIVSERAHFPVEFFNSEKTALNSNLSCKTYLYTDESGEDCIARGKYNFQMLLRHFDDDLNNPGYKRMIEFISELLGVDDVRKHYYFHGDKGVDPEKIMCKKLHEMAKYEWYQKKVGDFYEEMKELWNGPCQPIWFWVIFGYGKKTASNNTDTHEDALTTKTFLRNRRGANKFKIQVNGEIIVPIDDEDLFNDIMRGKGWCKYLDGGLCRIDYIGDTPPCFGYENEWSKIS